MTDREKIKAEIEKHMDELYPMLPDARKVLEGKVTVEELQCTAKYRAYERVVKFIDGLTKQYISKDLKEAAEEYAATDEILPSGRKLINYQEENAFKAGAEWQREKVINMLSYWLEDFICDWVEIDRESLISSFNNYYNSNGDIFGVNRNFKEE